MQCPFERVHSKAPQWVSAWPDIMLSLGHNAPVQPNHSQDAQPKAAQPSAQLQLTSSHAAAHSPAEPDSQVSRALSIAVSTGLFLSATAGSARTTSRSATQAHLCTTDHFLGPGCPASLPPASTLGAKRGCIKILTLPDASPHARWPHCGPGPRNGGLLCDGSLHVGLAVLSKGVSRFAPGVRISQKQGFLFF